MRDRLIELISQVQYMGGLEGKLADHLLAAGVVVIPCKKGDTLYCDGKHFADHCSGEVMAFPADIILTEVCSTHRGEIDMVFDFNRFGKDVFLTKEEAERALSERREG